MGKNNLAYDLSRFENANIEKDEKVKIRVTKVKTHQGSPVKVILITLTAGLLMGLMLYAKVQQAALHSEITTQTKQFKILQSENVRLASEIEGKFSIKSVEDYAENILGMQKLDKSQIEYMSIENGNIIDIPQNDDNVFIKIKNAVSDFVEYIRG